jgi:hypothetical protein
MLPCGRTSWPTLAIAIRSDGASLVAAVVNVAKLEQQHRGIVVPLVDRRARARRDRGRRRAASGLRGHGLRDGIVIR